MTNLRTRIAQAIFKRFECPHGDLADIPDDWESWWVQGSDEDRKQFYDQADAVIRELGLDGHTESFIDADGDKRCSTCDKWLEPGYYTLRDHRRAMLRDVVDEWTADE